MGLTFGVDSSWSNGTPAWQLALDDERMKFVVARACYGSNPADDDGQAFVDAHDAVKGASLPFGAYFYWLMGQNGSEQAKHFLEAANGRFGTIAPVVDVEEGSGALGWGNSVDERITNLAATLTTIQQRLGQPMIYTDANTWATFFGSTDAFAGHRLWLADWSTAPGEATVIPGFRELVLHQFSDGTGLPPIAGLSTPTNNVDRDVLVARDFAELGRR